MIVRAAPVMLLVVACVLATSTADARHHHYASPFVERGGGTIVSHKTGATAHVAVAYASRFQAYIDELEAHGAIVKFIGGIRRGPCSSASLHPCGKALDVCQTGRGRVDPSCHLPGRAEIARIAANNGLFEGGQWCSSDYGHAQVGETASRCGGNLYAAVTAFHARRDHRLAQTIADPLLVDRFSPTN